MHKEAFMAQKGGNMKRFILIVIFLAVFVAVFILLGGGNFLKSAGTWIGGLGKQGRKHERENRGRRNR